METSQVHEFAAPAQRPGRFITLGRQFQPRTRFIALAAVGIGAGLFLGWEWLAAAGLASFVVGLLPCAAMCAAGLCANRFGGKGGCHGGTGAAAPQGGMQPEDKS